MGVKKKNEKNSRWKILLIIIGVLVLMVMWLGFGQKGLIHLYRTEIERQAYVERIRELTEENKALLDEIKRLRTDMEYVESVVRENFNMVKSNEVIYRFESENRGDQNPRDSIKGHGNQKEREE